MANNHAAIISYKGVESVNIVPTFTTNRLRLQSFIFNIIILDNIKAMRKRSGASSNSHLLSSIAGKSSVTKIIMVNTVMRRRSNITTRNIPYTLKVFHHQCWTLI